MPHTPIINLAVIAHVDAGKSTLVDAFLDQSGVFNINEVHEAQVMDSNDLERERGITIYAKNCAIEHKGTKINIVDTPGHADFSSEVERIIKTVDTVILLVDASEGPMPQTRVVLEKALKEGLKPIVLINKIDKKEARLDEVVNECFDLFVDLGATDEQCDFPIVYGVAKQGKATLDPASLADDLTPLFDVILAHVPPYPQTPDEPLLMQVSSLGYDDYLGRLGMGRITRGTLKIKTPYTWINREGTLSSVRIVKCFVNEGLGKIAKDAAGAGDMVVFSGIAQVSIGDVLCDPNHIETMPPLTIERPTLAMHFLVNDGPFVGQSGSKVTSSQLKDRLRRELETNVGLEVEPLDGIEGFKVSGRGELHLSILLENMRREGYELCVSKPEVLFKTIKGAKHEPYEKVIITAPDDAVSTIINTLNQRKGLMVSMESQEGFTKLIYTVPTRGLIGYRGEFITLTRGRGTLEKSFASYEPYAGEIQSYRQGVFIAKEAGKTMAYSLFNLSERGRMMVGPSVPVYEGMIVGINSRQNDLVVNPCKNKQLTNVRSSGADEALKLVETLTLTLEESLAFINEDELVEVTPGAIRLRKKILEENKRKRAVKNARLEELDL